MTPAGYSPPLSRTHCIRNFVDSVRFRHYFSWTNSQLIILMKRNTFKHEKNNFECYFEKMVLKFEFIQTFNIPGRHCLLWFRESYT